MEENSEFKNRMLIMMWLIGILSAAFLIYAFGVGALELYKGIFLPFYRAVGRFMSLYGVKTIMAFMAIGMSAMFFRAISQIQKQLSRTFKLDVRDRNKKIKKLEDQVCSLSEKLGQATESKKQSEQVIQELKSKNTALKTELRNLEYDLEKFTAPEKVAEAEKKEEQAIAKQELQTAIPYVFGVK